MGDILERLLLIGLGLGLILLIFPVIDSVWDTLPNDLLEDDNTYNQISEDLRHLQSDIEKINGKKDFNLTYEFTFDGNIIVAIEELSSDDEILLFRFKSNNSNSIYEKFKISNEYLIIISNYVHFYNLSYQNNSIILKFY